MTWHGRNVHLENSITAVPDMDSSWHYIPTKSLLELYTVVIVFAAEMNGRKRELL